MKKAKQLAMLLCLVLIFTSVFAPADVSAASKKTTKSITLNVKKKKTMYVGMKHKIKVKSVSPKGSSKKVTYKSSAPVIASVSKKGTVKALKEGKTTITVTSKANTKVKKKVKVTVKNLIKNKTYNKIVIPLDKKKKTAKLSSNVKVSSLKFSSNKKKVATVTKKGVVKGKKPGIAKVTVKGKKGSVKGAKQVLTVYVAKESVEGAVLNTDKVNLKKGEAFQLDVTVTPEGACNQSVYTSSNEEVATVDEEGKIVANNIGTSVVTVTTIDGKKKMECQVTVTENGTTTDQPGNSDTDKPGTSDTDKPGDSNVSGNTPGNPETEQPGDSNVSGNTPGNPETEQPGEGDTNKDPETPGDTDQPGEGDTEKEPEIPITPGDADVVLPDVTNAVDSDTLINEGIQIANGDETLHVGEFIGINAFCFPYAWHNQNNYVLESSNTEVVAVDKAHVAYAVGEGEAQITAYTTDGKYKDTIDVKVLPKMTHSYNSQKIYVAEIEKFGLTCNTAEDDPLSISIDTAYNNSNAIMSMLGYAQTKGYEVVKLPAGKVIYIDPANTIYMKSNVALDLNGSELRIVPNDYQTYVAIDFREGGMNAFNGFVGGTETTYDKYTKAKKFTYKNVDDSVFLEPIPVCTDNSLYNKDNYSGKWLEKGEKTRFDMTYIRTNNSNVAIYAHYLKDGKEVHVQKMDALYGMSENTLMKQKQSFTLNKEYDYDSVQFELRAQWGRTSDYTFCECKIYTASTQKLNNASIVNGTITGERSTKSKTYPNWASDAKTEGSCSIIFSQGENNGIKNLTVKDSVGFNMSAGDGSMMNYTIVSYKNLELGAFDSQGNKVDCSTMIRNSDYYDVSKFKSNKYILGYHFGYQDIEGWSHSRIYDVFYYDENKNLLSYEKGLMRFRQYEMPEGTCYMNIALYDAEVPTSGNSDFGGAISMLEERDLPIRNFIEDCIIENNYSTGFAACGGQRWSIKGNTWRKNNGRMPGCDIDWEDGWNYMQCDMIYDNEFLSYNNVITCAGMYSSVFLNNIFYGKSTFYEKSNYYSFVKNQVIKDEEKVNGSCGNVAFGTRSDIWIYDNTFTGGGSITNYRMHPTASYRINYVGNHFSGGTTLTATGNEYITGCDFTGEVGVVSDNVRNSTFTDCSHLSIKGTLTNCTLNNVNIFTGTNADHINIQSCDMTDVKFPGEAHKVGTVLVEDCNIKFEKNTNFIGYDQGKPSIAVRNCVMDLSKVQDEFVLVDAYSVGNAQVNYLFENNQVIKPDKLTGYILKASWLQPATSENKLTITFDGTNFDELQDCNKTSGNFVIIRDEVNDVPADDDSV